ncbi:hypothetical protein BHE74_00007755 [Ensete ventricosum]|uniref:Uncharacterized protein n=1 Tax=Ensete ventricosum TaxID=4639 RepID=A0A445MEI7_ENSVE|nr:hypothetical protein BHE74_00007755 [Ensete ventricosum]RZR72661.1 hypothetical protein BHM03_00015569 [Ensete ventricosum]
MGPKCSPDHSFSVGQLNRVFQRRPFFKGPCMSRVSFLYPSSTSSLSLSVSPQPSPLATTRRTPTVGGEEAG